MPESYEALKVLGFWLQTRKSEQAMGMGGWTAAKSERGVFAEQTVLLPFSKNSLLIFRFLGGKTALLLHPPSLIIIRSPDFTLNSP